MATGQPLPPDREHQWSCKGAITHGTPPPSPGRVRRGEQGRWSKELPVATRHSEFKKRTQINTGDWHRGKLQLPRTNKDPGPPVARRVPPSLRRSRPPADQFTAPEKINTGNKGIRLLQAFKAYFQNRRAALPLQGSFPTPSDFPLPASPDSTPPKCPTY